MNNRLAEIRRKYNKLLGVIWEREEIGTLLALLDEQEQENKTHRGEKAILDADIATLTERYVTANDCIIEAELALEEAGRPEGERLAKGIVALADARATLTAKIAALREVLRFFAGIGEATGATIALIRKTARDALASPIPEKEK